MPYLEFDRPAETLEEAILSAIQAVEATHLGARVLRVEPNPLVSILRMANSRGELSAYPNLGEVSTVPTWGGELDFAS